MRAFSGTLMLILVCWHLKQISTCTMQKWMELLELVKEMGTWNCGGEYRTPKDVQSNCTDCALQCFSDELYNVEDYCPNNIRKWVITDIHSLLSIDTEDCKTTPQPCHTCNSCKDHTEMSFKKYTEEFLSLVQNVVIKVNYNYLSK